MYSYPILIILKQIYLFHWTDLIHNTSLCLSAPGSNGNAYVFHIPQNWSLITSCSFVSYLGHTFLGGLTRQRMQSVYSRPCRLVEVLIWFEKNMLYIYIYIYIYHHDHHVVLLAPISLILSCHSSLSFIASGRSSRLHRVSVLSCCR